MLVTADGKPVQRDHGFCSGLWAPLVSPDADDLPAEEFAQLPTPELKAHGTPVHCVRGGQTLCGALVSQGETVARLGQLALITCPACRTAAERA